MEQPGTTPVIACIFFQTPVQNLEKLAEACYRFTPQIAMREGEAVFLEMSGSLGLFAAHTLPQRLRTIAHRLGFFPSKISMAADPATALALSRHSCSDARKLPIEAITDYASPFKKNRDLEKLITRQIELFESLGIKTLHQFSQLPPGTLASRFGKEGLEISQRIRLTRSQPWPTFRLPEVISEKMDLTDTETQDGCFSLDGLLFASKSLLDRIFARLYGRGMRLSALTITVSLYDYGTSPEVHPPSSRERERVFKLALPLPQGSAQGLIPILREMLAFELDRVPLSAPGTRIELVVTESVPGRSAQRNFFSRREEDAEQWDALVARICLKLGPQGRAFTAVPVERHLPEKAWKGVTLALHSAGGVAGTNGVPGACALPLPDRPTRLLKSPQPLQREGDWIYSLAHGRRLGRARQWSGPERIAHEWWEKPENDRDTLSRDYYRVELETGERLWVFQAGPSFRYYLHGYFD